MKQQLAKWLSCWGSIKDKDYCNAEAKCPAVWGGQSASSCYGEKFQIQTTSGGPIKFEHYGGNLILSRMLMIDNKIAFYYAKNEHGRTRDDDAKYFWLSKYYQDKTAKAANYLYTMPCPGKTFTKQDISRCRDEVFSIYKYNLKDGYLRNGDRILIEEIGEVFLLQQYYGVEDEKD